MKEITDTIKKKMITLLTDESTSDKWIGPVRTLLDAVERIEGISSLRATETGPVFNAGVAFPRPAGGGAADQVRELTAAMDGITRSQSVKARVDARLSILNAIILDAGRTEDEKKAARAKVDQLLLETEEYKEEAAV